MSLLDRFVFEVNLGTFFGAPIWYDLSAYLNLEAGPLTVTRGRQQERATPTPGQLHTQLINDDGRFTPGNTTSPYTPYVLDGAPTRLSYLAANTNLEDNSSHEGSIAEWSAGGTGTAPAIAPDTTHVYPDSGQWAMRVTWVNQATDSLAQRVIYGLTVGQTYTWSRYVYVPAGSPNVRLQVGDHGLFAAGSYVSTKDSFARATVTFVATYTSHALQVQVASSVGGGQCWTDAGQGEEGSSATTLMPSAVRLPQYYGHALEWPFGWQGPAALAAATQFAAVDLLRRLPRRSELRPMVIEEALLDSPLVLLPLDEPDGATQAGNLGSVQSTGTLVHRGTTGTFAFGAGTGPPADGSSSLVLTPVYSAPGMSGWYFNMLLGFSASAVTVEAWINTTMTTPSTNWIVELSNVVNGSAAVADLVVFLGKLFWFSDRGNLTVTSAASVNDGATHHVAAVYAQDGVNHTATIYIDGQAAGTASIADASVGLTATYLQVAGNYFAQFSGTINHAAVYAAALSADRIAAHYHAGWDGFGGERSDQRISRLASYAGLDSLTPATLTTAWTLDSAAYSVLDTTTILAGSDLNLEVGSSTVYGQAAGGGDVLAAMNDVADTEGGVVLIDRSGQLQFQARSHRYNRPPSVTPDSADVDPGLSPAYDDALVVNSVAVSTQDGAKLRVIDQASVAQRGVYEQQLDLLTRDALDAYSTAAWIAGRQAEPQVRYTSVTFDLATLPAAQVNALLAMDIGDRLDVTGLPPQAPRATEPLFVEGLELVVSPSRLTLTLNTTPADGWQVWQLDSPTLSVLDTTTVLAY